MRLDDLSDLLADLRTDPVEICEIEQNLVDHLGGTSRLVLLSRETILKQRQRHPELTLEDYALLPLVLGNGIVYPNRARQLRFTFHYAPLKRWGYQAVVKWTEGGLYVVTYYPMRARRMFALAKTPLIVRKRVQ